MNTPMKKRRFIVDGMIYPGIHILSGDPKIGKSWMMLDMCLTVAKGEDFIGRKTEQGQVVYMALEDTFVSLQSRMYELTDEPNARRSTHSYGSGNDEKKSCQGRNHRSRIFRRLTDDLCGIYRRVGVTCLSNPIGSKFEPFLRVFKQDGSYN